jgi:hypothetical protein
MDTPPIRSATDSTRICWTCGTPVSLETCKIDQRGKAVHELCYVAKIITDGKASRRKRSETKPPEGRWWP